MTNETMPLPSGGTDHRDGNPTDTRIIAQLVPRWRVVESHDGLQWIVQHSRLNKGVMRWYGLYYLRSKAGLLRYVGELEGQGEFTADPAALTTLARLPAWLDARDGKIRSKAGDRKVEVAAA